MTRAWQELERVETPAGVLALRRRGEADFLITLGGRVLMNSHANRSELALAEESCRGLADRTTPRILLGGLGMGCTLRAALDALPPRAHVLVAEIEPAIERWCRGPLAAVNGCALADPRVEIVIEDVAGLIARRARDRAQPRFDAVLLDLFEGPHARTDPTGDPFYGSRALAHGFGALGPGGVLGVWCEAPDVGFERRLARAGFRVECRRPGRGGRRHAVYLAWRGAEAAPGAPATE